MATFNNFIDDNNLLDLGMVGRPFTWSNRRRGQELIQERFDRVLATLNWCASYPTATILRLQEDGLDHAPLLLDSNPYMEKTKRRFKFQERWYWNAEVKAIVEESWKIEIVGSPMFIFAQKLKRCRHSLV
ncbi:Reverse transcriptase [Arachis hypogaea]|nr:Reverse transcriptase [Arachis hypogaea]